MTSREAKIDIEGNEYTAKAEEYNGRVVSVYCAVKVCADSVAELRAVDVERFVEEADERGYDPEFSLGWLLKHPDISERTAQAASKLRSEYTGGRL